MSDYARDIQIWSDIYRLLPAWTWETDADYRLRYLQDSIEDHTGVKRDALLGFMILLEEYEERSGTNSDSYLSTLRNKEPVECIPYERVLLNGDKVVLVDNAVPRFDENGAFQGYRGMSLNLSEVLRRSDEADGLVASLQSHAWALEAELAAHAARLEESNHLLSGILDAMAEGVLVTSKKDLLDPENRIVLANPAYCALFGLEESEIWEGMRISELTALLQSKDRLPSEPHRLKEVRSGLGAGEKVLLEIAALDKVYYAKAAPGPLGGQVLVHADVTVLEQQNDALRAARDAAEVANRAKSNFLATMSHEIRTPMNGIVGMADLLSDCDLNAECAGYVETIRSSAMALSHLISDILDFSKIEAGELKLASQSFDPRRLAQEMAELLRPMAAAKGLDFEVEIDASVPELLSGDPMRLRQILLNLLGNAVKFTLKGAVGISIRADDRLHIAVHDTGIGIPADDLPHIFNAFQQVESGRERQFEGTGLGLSISKQLVDLMGGRIDVSSEPGIGTRFDLDLPLRAVVAEIKQAAQDKPEEIWLDDVDILVAEDNRTNQLVVRKMLEKRNATVTLAQNGRVAVDLCGQKRFDIILMDISMPEMSGLEATRHIRTRELEKGWPETPILALTGNAFDRDREEALAIGMNGFLSKPVRRDALLACIARHLETGDKISKARTG